MELSFFTMPEYEQWKETTADAKNWKVKYYKVFILTDILTNYDVYFA